MARHRQHGECAVRERDHQDRIPYPGEDAPRTSARVLWRNGPPPPGARSLASRAAIKVIKYAPVAPPQSNSADDIGGEVLPYIPSS